MKKFLNFALIALTMCFPVTMQAKVEHLLPLPQEVAVTEGVTFALSGNITINYANGVESCELLEEFFTSNGCILAEGGKAVNVSLVASIDDAHDYELHGYENEAYTLEITANEINITAVTATGIIRAAQTLTQLAEGWDGAPALEALTMKDWPAFKLRGYMHDVGRSFISTDELVKQIELFSRFKVNTFHWHLTENQAWRFEVKAYPALTSDASMTRFPGEYYTQEDCKRVMTAAKKHGVIVIPEIDMPGHSEAFERAMGFDMQSEQGKEVLKKVLDEVVEVFADAPYIHIGGDEVSTTAAYLNEMIAYVQSKGKKGGLWNPINGIGQDALNNTLAQMWGTRGYLASNKANIDCRYNYTNHFDVFADLVGIYKSNIYYHQQGTPEVAGAISGCWNDRKVATEKDIMAQNNVWANVIATAERAWIGGGKQYIDNMTNTPNNLKTDGGHGGVMLPNSGDEYEEFKSWETRFLFHKANSLKGEPIPYVKQTNIRWRITDAFPNGGSETATFGPEAAGTTASTDLLPEIFTHNGKTYYTGMATGAGIYLSHTWGNSIIDAYYENPQYNHTAYAWTYVYSPVAQTVGAQIEFQNYSRSEQDGAAPAGKWDHFGSKIWVNGIEIAAPTWDNTGVSINSKEVMLKNENFPGREPVEVTLKQGWNKVFLKLPYFNKGYRLKKWMFTFVLTDLEGRNAVDGLIYSPNQCMDEATEAVAAEISNIKRNRGAYIGTAVGQWPESVAEALDAKVKEVEASYSATKTAEERAEQVKELEAAWTAFFASLASAKINQPTASTADKAVYYRMCTPQRESRYPTAKGVGADIVGEQTPNDNSIWKFVVRTDGSFDIINAVENSFISPASNNNTALRTVSDQPSAGWTIKPATTKGLVIITSGSAQFNQTNNSQLGYKVYNWGSGSNTTDTGCQYLFEEVEYTPSDVTVHEGLPTPGASYYIYADTYKDGKFLNRYLYNDNGTLKLSTELDKGANSYIWTAASSSEGKYSFANKAGKYLAHKGMSDSKHEFTVAVSTRHMGITLHSGSGKNYFVIHNNDGRFDQSSVTYDQTKENYCTDFVLVPVVNTENLPSLAVASPALANATFTWNNEEITSTPYYLEEGTAITNPTLTLKTYNKAYKFEGFFTDAAYTTPLASTTIETLTPGLTIYAKFTLDVFSANFGDKLIRLKMFRDASYSAGLKSAANNAAGSTQVCDLTATTELWYLVGNADAFKLYNKAVGGDYALNVNGTSDGSAASMATAASATTWKLITKDGGYAIVPSNATGMSINAYGGKGGDLKLYNAGDQGGWWVLDAVSESAFSLEVAVDQVWASSPRVAELNMTLNGVSSSTRIMGSVTEKTYYLPTYATTFSLSSMTYRGYTFNGFAEGVESYKNQEIPAEGINITATYTANEERSLFYTPRDGHPYRIPAIATAPNGDIFAVCDYRPCGNDIGYGEVDLVCRVSSDNGVTWTEEKCIADGQGDAYAANDTSKIWQVGFGDPAIVADCERNEVLVMSVCGNQTCWDGTFGEVNPNPNRVARIRIKYDDEKGEWVYGQVEEVTYDIYPKFVDKAGNVHAASLFIGAGKICQSRVVKKGDYYRLYCAVWNVTKTQRQHHNYVIYSDDFGQTWNVLGNLGYNNCPSKYGNEPKCEELPDGTVVLSSRKNGGRYFNLFTFDDDSYTTGSWGTEASSNDITGGLSFGGNSTNGEIYKVAAIRNSDGAKCDIMFQSIPTGSDRSNVAIYYKEMVYNPNGTNKYTPTGFSQGWTKGKHVSTKGSCYSTMILQADGRIAFFFEEEPGGYTMVYIPYTIEELTGGAYSVDTDYVGIEEVESAPHSQSSAIYDLMGRKLDKATERGIYIVEGKKVIF